MQSQIPNQKSPVRYAELAVASNFTFLTGASHPEELVQQAAELGYAAVAITDTNTLAGVVRAHVAAREAGLPLVVGCRLELEAPAGQDAPDSAPDAPAGRRLSVLVYPTDRPAYGRLCQLLTLGKRRAHQGAVPAGVARPDRPRRGPAGRGAAPAGAGRGFRQSPARPARGVRR